MPKIFTDTVKLCRSETKVNEIIITDKDRFNLDKILHTLLTFIHFFLSTKSKILKEKKYKYSTVYTPVL